MRPPSKYTTQCITSPPRPCSHKHGPSPPHAPFIQLWDTHSPDGYPIANFTEHSLEVTMLAPLSRAWGTQSHRNPVCVPHALVAGQLCGLEPCRQEPLCDCFLGWHNKGIGGRAAPAWGRGEATLPDPLNGRVTRCGTRSCVASPWPRSQNTPTRCTGRDGIRGMLPCLHPLPAIAQYVCMTPRVSTAQTVMARSSSSSSTTCVYGRLTLRWLAGAVLCRGSTSWSGGDDCARCSN